MKEKSRFEQDILDAIKWQPLLDHEVIDVTDLNGVIKLSGVVDSYVKKKDIEKTVTNVHGVSGIIENIEVKIPDSLRRDDQKIAKDANVFLALNKMVPKDTVKFKVNNGWLTLDGEVNQLQEKEAAMESIHYITGITGITDNITILQQTENKIIN
jgi:osmotically-inducible protein OsmY